MKKVIMALMVLLSVMVTGCSAKQEEVKEPEVNLDITVEALSEEEYADTGTEGICRSPEERGAEERQHLNGRGDHEDGYGK